MRDTWHKSLLCHIPDFEVPQLMHLQATGVALRAKQEGNKHCMARQSAAAQQQLKNPSEPPIKLTGKLAMTLSPPTVRWGRPLTCSRSGTAGKGLALASTSAIGPELPQTKIRFCITCAGITVAWLTVLVAADDSWVAQEALFTLPRAHGAASCAVYCRQPAKLLLQGWAQLCCRA